jgi:hypothetical protein
VVRLDLTGTVFTESITHCCACCTRAHYELSACHNREHDRDLPTM